MPEPVDWIADADWRTIIANVPILSVDLVVITPVGVVLGRRTNEPARGEWFVPGGRVRKGESLAEAVHRVAHDELGIDIVIRERLGVYEHVYETAEQEDVGGKHYVPIGFVVKTGETEFPHDSQHDVVRTFDPKDLPSLHEYTDAYLRDAGLIPDA